MSVLIATLKRGESSDSYVDSLLRTFTHARTKIAGVVNAPASVNTISLQRNRAAQALLASESDRLLFVDSDMGWPTDALDRLVEVDLSVVGALCFGLQQTAEDGMGGYHTRPYPTLFGFDGSYEIRWDYARNQVVQVDGTGAAFLLIHRDVLLKTGPGWFDRLELGGELLGEDLSFCHRLREADIPVHVHTGVRTSHYKPTWVTEETYVGSRIQSAVAESRMRGGVDAVRAG